MRRSVQRLGAGPLCLTVRHRGTDDGPPFRLDSSRPRTWIAAVVSWIIEGFYTLTFGLSARSWIPRTIGGPSPATWHLPKEIRMPLTSGDSGNPCTHVQGSIRTPCVSRGCPPGASRRDPHPLGLIHRPQSSARDSCCVRAATSGSGMIQARGIPHFEKTSLQLLRAINERSNVRREPARSCTT